MPFSPRSFSLPALVLALLSSFAPNSRRTAWRASKHSCCIGTVPWSRTQSQSLLYSCEHSPNCTHLFRRRQRQIASPLKALLTTSFQLVYLLLIKKNRKLTCLSHVVPHPLPRPLLHPFIALAFFLTFDIALPCPGLRPRPSSSPSCLPSPFPSPFPLLLPLTFVLAPALAESVTFALVL